MFTTAATIKLNDVLFTYPTIQANNTYRLDCEEPSTCKSQDYEQFILAAACHAYEAELMKDTLFYRPASVILTGD